VFKYWRNYEVNWHDLYAEKKLLKESDLIGDLVKATSNSYLCSSKTNNDNGSPRRPLGAPADRYCGKRC
jgi:hypothetical protein